MKKHSTSRKSFNESAGLEDDPPWYIIQCPNCKDKDATQNKAMWWCRECGWNKPGEPKVQWVDHSLPYVDPEDPGAPPTATLTEPQPKAPEAPQPTPAKPTGHPIILTCRTVITKRK